MLEKCRGCVGSVRKGVRGVIREVVLGVCVGLYASVRGTCEECVWE